MTSVIFDAAVVSIESCEMASNIETCDGDMVSAPGSLPSNAADNVGKLFHDTHSALLKLRIMSWELVLWTGVKLRQYGKQR